MILFLLGAGLAVGALGSWRRDRRLLVVAAALLAAGIGLASMLALALQSM